jgi:hypothetical protein
MNAQSCALCGDTNPTVRVGLVEWIEPIEEQRFAAVPRCQDRKACRERVKASGEQWEVREPVDSRV